MDIENSECVAVEEDGKEGVSLRSWYGIRGIPYPQLMDKEGPTARQGALGDVLERARSLK